MTDLVTKTDERGMAISPVLPEDCKNFLIDIDGTICNTPVDQNGNPDYLNAYPNLLVRDQINNLYCQNYYYQQI